MDAYGELGMISRGDGVGLVDTGNSNRQGHLPGWRATGEPEDKNVS